MNTIPEIANRLTSLCNELKFVEAYTELYADSAVSIDPNNKNEPLTGLHTLIEYEKQFLEKVEIHDVKVSDAIFAGNYFSLVFSMHFTVKG
ncbi:SnoaL-like domain-containing protein [Mucilaginibacter sp.]|uniref:SnoaL-like domain-containing protein n=1 Tax=Mucilaginibacter sp. TaxID=1882438 RepID=UPI0025D1F729|nr:SnoaL-like domain-containing protein [Mucilaginibacter sp.]